MKNSFILKGGIAFSDDREKITTYESGYLVCVDGKVDTIIPGDELIPEKYDDLQVYDYSDSLIIPGMTDLHLHAPQYTYRGIGMDLELLDWLTTHTFPEEAKYEDIRYARHAYAYFAEDRVFENHR